MTRANQHFSNWTAGEFSPRLWGRDDLEKYGNAARRIDNFTVTAHGGLKKRPGTRFVVEMPDETEEIRLVPFQYNTEQSYVLVFGPGYIWFLRDQGILIDNTQEITGITRANPAVVTSSSHGFLNGQQVYLTGIKGMGILNNRMFTVAGVTTDTFQLSGINSSSYDAYTSGGSADQFVTLATTFTAAELDDLRFAQSADVLYVCHPNHSPKKITRTSDTVWTLSELGAELGPFRTINDDQTHTLTFSSWSASATAYGTHNVGDTVTVTSSDAIFADGHIGSLWRIKEAGKETGLLSAPVGDSSKSISVGDTYTNESRVYGVAALSGFANWGGITRVPAHESGTVRVKQGANYYDAAYLHDLSCVIKILTVTSTTVATAQIVHNHMPASVVTAGTSFWEEGSWSDYRGWPREVTLFEQRLWFASNEGEPQTVWGSRSAEYENFQDGADDDDSVIYALSSGEVDVVRWLRGGRVLTAGTSSGEYAISASSQQEALTPSNVAAKLQTAYGSSSTRPIELGQIVLFPQRNGDPDNFARKVREYGYSFENDAFQAVNVTIFSEHITAPGIVEMAKQLEPDNIIWCVRSDGVLLGMTYEKDQSVIAWHKHTMGGTNTKAKRVASVPGDNGDDVYLVVDRTVNGETKRMIEALQPYYGEEPDEKEDAWFLDSALNYAGASTTTLSGLFHLEGETLKAWNNGTSEDVTVTDGGVTLATATTKCTVGLPIASRLDTLPLSAGTKAGTSQSRKRHVNKAALRLLSSRDGRVGVNGTTTAPILYLKADGNFDSTGALFSGWQPINIASEWSRDNYVTVTHDEPSPMFIIGIVAETNVTG